MPTPTDEHYPPLPRPPGRHAHIAETYETRQFSAAAMASLPGWREQRVRVAHANLLRERQGLPSLPQHPVRRP